jgi:hypothetical protein
MGGNKGISLSPLPVNNGPENGFIIGEVCKKQAKVPTFQSNSLTIHLFKFSGCLFDHLFWKLV